VCPVCPVCLALLDAPRTQLDQARVVALLRRIGVPLAQIRARLALDPASAVERIRDYWAGHEMEHAAQRELVGYLVDRLHGKKPAMYEVAVRDIPERSLLSLMRHLHQDEVMQTGREFFIHPIARGGVARVEGIAGAPFTIYYAEVSGDSDGPVEFCWPAPRLCMGLRRRNDLTTGQDAFGVR
jgi:hypothetical protein